MPSTVVMLGTMHVTGAELASVLRDDDVARSRGGRFLLSGSADHDLVDVYNIALIRLQETGNMYEAFPIDASTVSTLLTRKLVWLFPGVMFDCGALTIDERILRVAPDDVVLNDVSPAADDVGQRHYGTIVDASESYVFQRVGGRVIAHAMDAFADVDLSIGAMYEIAYEAQGVTVIRR